MACCLANVSQGWVNVRSISPLGHHGDPGDPTDRGMGRRGLRRESVESLGCIRGASRAGCLLQRRPALSSPTTGSPREKWPWDLVCGPAEALLPASTCCSQTSLAPIPVWLLIVGRGRSLGKLPVHGIMCWHLGLVRDLNERAQSSSQCQWWLPLLWNLLDWPPRKCPSLCRSPEAVALCPSKTLSRDALLSLMVCMSCWLPDLALL